MYQNQSMTSTTKEDVEAVDILVKEIVRAINQHTIKCDRTFKSAVIGITPKGKYVIRDETGCEREVKCSIPGAELKPGMYVWVKIPCSDLKGIHICGVV